MSEDAGWGSRTGVKCSSLELLKIKVLSTWITSVPSTDHGAALQPQRQVRRWQDKATNVGGSAATNGSIARMQHAPRGNNPAAVALKDKYTPTSFLHSPSLIPDASSHTLGHLTFPAGVFKLSWFKPNLFSWEEKATCYPAQPLPSKAGVSVLPLLSSPSSLSLAVPSAVPGLSSL